MEQKLESEEATLVPHSIGLDSLLQKTPNKGTVQRGDAIGDTASKSQGLKLSNSKPGWGVSALIFTSL
jgi:hypothetical protein